MIRLFVAIDLPKEIKDYFYSIQQAIIKKIDTRETKIKWVAKKNFHQTIRFISWVEENKLEEIREKLKKIKVNEFKAKLDCLSAYPTENNIRVIFVDMVAPEIFDIHKEVEEKLKGIGKDDAQFSTHLTLGRVKFCREKKRLSEILKNIKIEPKEFTLDGIKLFQSILTKEGPIYKEIDY
ncbi:RNA 2',3'-cyclic phosphodiesterase [Candidatus Woesearchaeota archaeon]|nr:RNA 2',3'-cyclic phosphodiesterase [Candidatus Woesearchaeota archaeon]